MKVNTEPPMDAKEPAQADTNDSVGGEVERDAAVPLTIQAYFEEELRQEELQQQKEMDDIDTEDTRLDLPDRETELDLASDEEEDENGNVVKGKRRQRKTDDEILSDIRSTEEFQELGLRQKDRWNAVLSKLARDHHENPYNPRDPDRDKDTIDMREGSGLDGKHFTKSIDCLKGNYKMVPDGKKTDAAGNPILKSVKMSLKEQREKNAELKRQGIICKCELCSSRRDFRCNSIFADMQKQKEEDMEKWRQEAASGRIPKVEFNTAPVTNPGREPPLTEDSDDNIPYAPSLTESVDLTNDETTDSDGPDLGQSEPSDDDMV